ncbi:LOW QUALITY PROTEIN: hypothetical protein KUTeg_016619 [Tegillarca granosa]|uniref:Uncharacterized protein n=1 Tax=Tegillarca granosa TaxID=220873 RepID=A0ABQ9EMB4_TEGGR|nr:LOW QUALITY PROTEIN: hypothetical protein KUTeg_016619 [Tegillarca granosa]
MSEEISDNFSYLLFQSTCSPRTGLYKVDLMAFGAISRSFPGVCQICGCDVFAISSGNAEEAEVPIGHVQFADLLETGVFSFSNTTDIEFGSSDFLWDLKHFPVIVTILPSVCCKTKSNKWKFAVELIQLMSSLGYESCMDNLLQHNATHSGRGTVAAQVVNAFFPSKLEYDNKRFTGRFEHEIDCKLFLTRKIK